MNDMPKLPSTRLLSEHFRVLQDLARQIKIADYAPIFEAINRPVIDPAFFKSIGSIRDFPDLTRTFVALDVNRNLINQTLQAAIRTNYEILNIALPNVTTISSYLDAYRLSSAAFASVANILKSVEAVVPTGAIVRQVAKETIREANRRAAQAKPTQVRAEAKINIEYGSAEANVSGEIYAGLLAEILTRVSRVEEQGQEAERLAAHRHNIQLAIAIPALVITSIGVLLTVLGLYFALYGSPIEQTPAPPSSIGDDTSQPITTHRDGDDVSR